PATKVLVPLAGTVTSTGRQQYRRVHRPACVRGRRAHLSVRRSWRGGFAGGRLAGDCGERGGILSATIRAQLDRARGAVRAGSGNASFEPDGRKGIQLVT